MRLLLDTQSFLWFIMGSPRLSNRGRTLLEDAGNERLLSMASLWEVAVKISIGKLTLKEPFDVLMPASILPRQDRVRAQRHSRRPGRPTFEQSFHAGGPNGLGANILRLPRVDGA
jgi:hypothetical protein